MGLFKKKEDGKKFRLEMVNKIKDKRIRYVEEVIGKSGAFSVRDGEFIVFASSEVIMRTPAAELRAWELLSGDGVVLTGRDDEHGGTERTITAYYVYFR